MSPSVSKGVPARKLFVDREELIAEFLTRIHSDPTPNDILFLHGEGGIGKSLLLNHLQDRYSRHLQTPKQQFLHPWVSLSGMSPKNMVSAFDSYPSESLPCVLIDFSQSALGENPQDLFDGLQLIRRGLNLPAPFFHAACILYLDKQRRLTKDAMEHFFPGGGAELFSALADQANVGGRLADALHLMSQGANATTQIAAGGVFKGLWGFGAEIFAPHAARWFARRRLRGGSIEDLLAHKPGELLEALPTLLAGDINTSRDLDSRPHRLLLLFDAYDRFIGSEHHLSLRDRLSRDWWFRDFLAHLDLDNGIIVVVTAQEPPSWPHRLRVKVRPVDYLRREDALTFLRKADVEPEALREAMSRYAEVEAGLVQPLFLALLVDAHRFDLENGSGLDPAALSQNRTVKEKQQDIITRLLAAAGDNLAYAIRALAACRTFDWELFHFLGDALSFAPTKSMFETVTPLSCVRPAAGDAFRMHNLLRRFFGEESAPGEVHETCRRFFETKGEIGIADAIYHRHFLDAQAARASWIETFREGSRRSLHDRCAALLVLRAELEARDERLQGAFAGEVGEYLARRSQFADAERELSAAVNFWDAALALAPNLIEAHNNKGNALRRWADLRSRQSDHGGAEEKYRTAVAAYDAALALAPNLIEAHNNKGSALASWADLRSRQSDHGGAEEKYRTAVAAYDAALALAPNYIEAHNNKGLALASWALFALGREKLAEARDLFDASSEAFSTALAIASNPDSLAGLTRNLLLLAQRAEPESRCGPLHQARELITQWRAAFPWDESRIAQFEQFRRQLQERFECPDP